MGDRNGDHVAERFSTLLSLYRRPDGSEWGGQNLERATGGAVSRSSYVSNLKKGRIGDPGLSNLEVIAGAMGFPPTMWFGAGAGEDGPPVPAPGAAPEDEALGAILEEARKMKVCRRSDPRGGVSCVRLFDRSGH